MCEQRRFNVVRFASSVRLGRNDTASSSARGRRAASFSRAVTAVAYSVVVMGDVLWPGRGAAADVANATIVEIAIDPGYGNQVFIRLNELQPAIGCAPGGYWEYPLAFSSTAPV